ncbi:hypothetical protein CONPUDRAFT_73142 [Coniophora puteana RWD-64-598 SS2]|uniref:WD40 repeat-like protein n=1 Tax=Coniophora puteana (strain RWD-64-598) TaxID=741705 RepID=A0A5M3MS82_CONPW|nr:uncharacterized protein CONPUDRAFT_73142 [Coniophora puteana RWD-64-598 SS2]EIW81401.1 hypothetical protein CONPUDRAFT_73142 [Coniophora puteana RWD-64-598 SS2]
MLRGDAEHVWGDIHHLYSSIIDEIDPVTRAKGTKYLSLIMDLAEPLALSDLNQLFADHVHHYLVPFSALTMRTLLKRDICGLKDPSLLHEEIPDFAQRREGIPWALRYACHYWVHHLQHVSPDDEVQEQLLDFLQRRVLLAVEVYAVLGELGLGVNLLRTARRLVTAWPKDSFSSKEDVIALLYDSWRLTLDFFDPISSSALHVYESALPFSPAKSKIRQVYDHLLQSATVFTIEEGLDEEWNCVTRMISVDAKDLEFTATLSPDGSEVAAITPSSVHVWGTATGVLLASLPLGQPCLIRGGIAHSGSHIAFYQSSSALCHVWQPSHGTVISFGGDREAGHSMLMPFIGCVSFSHNEARLACLWGGADNLHQEVTVYDVITRQQLSNVSLGGFSQQPQRSILPFNRDRDWLRFKIRSTTIDFSHEGDCLMVHFMGSTLIFDPVTGREMLRRECCGKNHVVENFVLLFFGPEDAYIFHSSSYLPSRDLPQFRFHHSILPASRNYGRKLLSALPWSVQREASSSLGREEAGMADQPQTVPDSASRRACKIKRIKSGKGQTPSESSPFEVIYILGRDVGATMDGHTVAFCGATRTSWRTPGSDCVGMICEKSDIWLLDLIQAAHQPTFHLSSSDPYLENGYSFACTSELEDWKAYKCLDTENRYLIVDYKSSDGKKGTEILSETYVDEVITALSQSGNYFAIAGRSGSSKGTKVQIWDLAVEPTPVRCNWNGKRCTHIRFSSDSELIAILGTLEDGSYGVVTYSFSDDGLLRTGSISLHPQFWPKNSNRCAIASVGQDFVHLWARPTIDGTLVYLLRWKVATTEIATVAEVPHTGLYSFYPAISPCFERIYSKSRDSSIVMKLNAALENKAAQSEKWLYDVDEEHNPNIYYDALSWSDLCLGTDGWLRKRQRRLCWLPARYRPMSDQEGHYLRLVIYSGTVTFLGLKNNKRLTMRLLNTKIEYLN